MSHLIVHYAFPTGIDLTSNLLKNLHENHAKATAMTWEVSFLKVKNYHSHKFPSPKETSIQHIYGQLYLEDQDDVHHQNQV
jgi:hypothetical protein